MLQEFQPLIGTERSSLEKINVAKNDGRAVLESLEFQTNYSEIPVAIYALLNNERVQVGTYYNTPKTQESASYQNGLGILNGRGYNSYYEEHDNLTNSVQEILVKRIDYLIDIIISKKYEVYIINDIVINQKFLDSVCPYYVVYIKPVVTDGQYTSNIVTLIAKSKEVQYANKINLTPSFGGEQITEKINKQERTSTLEYSTMLLEFRVGNRELIIVNSYGNWLSNNEARLLDASAIIGAIKYLQNTKTITIANDIIATIPQLVGVLNGSSNKEDWNRYELEQYFKQTIIESNVYGGGDGNPYGVDTLNGNGLGKFAFRIFRNNQKEAIQIMNFYRDCNLLYKMPTKTLFKIWTYLEPTFYGASLISIQNSTGLKQSYLKFKRFITQFGLALPLDRIFTDDPELKIGIEEGFGDHAFVGGQKINNQGANVSILGLEKKFN